VGTFVTSGGRIRIGTPTLGRQIVSKDLGQEASESIASGVQDWVKSGHDEIKALSDEPEADDE
jgi:hypothetical protein